MSTTSNPRQDPLIRRDRRGWRDRGVVGALVALAVATGLAGSSGARRADRVSRGDPQGREYDRSLAAAAPAALRGAHRQRQAPLDTQCGQRAAHGRPDRQSRAGMRKLIARKCGGKNKICAASDSGAAADDSLASIGWNLGTCPDFDDAGCANEIHDCAGIADCLACVNRTPLGSAVALTMTSWCSHGDVQPSPQQVSAGDRSRGHALLHDCARALSSCWGSFNRGKKGFGSPCPVEIRRAHLPADQEGRAPPGEPDLQGLRWQRQGLRRWRRFHAVRDRFPSSCPDVVVPGPDVGAVAPRSGSSRISWRASIA